MDWPSVSIGEPAETLVLAAPRSVDGSVVVTIAQPGLHASRSIYLDAEEATGLLGFFQSLAADAVGWDGTREWSTFDGEFRLSSWHRRTDGVKIEVALGPEPWDAGWSATAVVTADSGDLSAIAGGVQQLWQDGGTGRG